MAYDLLFGRTKSDWSRQGKIAPPLTPDQIIIERKRLIVLEPATREVVQKVLEWARGQGMNILLGETYRSPEDQARIPENRTAIKPGDIGWHSVGRAFHLIIRDERGALDEAAYAVVGKYVRQLGGEWLGDKPLQTRGGPVIDLAHFEFHPDMKLSSYRKTALATKELASASKRAARYS
jgi:hypothetical protein